MSRESPQSSMLERGVWTPLAAAIGWYEERIATVDPLVLLRARAERFTTSHQFVETLKAVRERHRSSKSVGLRDLRGGRLILHFPENNLACGAAAVASCGYFDVDNVAPPDTWVTYVAVTSRRLATQLLTWVPPEFLALAGAGIRVIPEECTVWLEDADTEFAQMIRRELR